MKEFYFQQQSKRQRLGNSCETLDKEDTTKILAGSVWNQIVTCNWVYLPLWVFTSLSHIVSALLSLAGMQPDVAALWDTMSRPTWGTPVDLRTKAQADLTRFTTPPNFHIKRRQSRPPRKKHLQAISDTHKASTQSLSITGSWQQRGFDSNRKHPSLFFTGS